MTKWDIIDSLKKRGILLNPPIDREGPDWHEVTKRFTSFRAISEVYQWFDGFEKNTYDHQSFISLWPGSKIRANVTAGFEDQLVIGDWLIDSDLLIVDENEHILLLFENRSLATSLIGFLNCLCNGDFDIYQKRGG